MCISSWIPSGIVQTPISSSCIPFAIILPFPHSLTSPSTPQNQFKMHISASFLTSSLHALHAAALPVTASDFAFTTTSPALASAASTSPPEHQPYWAADLKHRLWARTRWGTMQTAMRICSPWRRGRITPRRRGIVHCCRVLREGRWRLMLCPRGGRCREERGGTGGGRTCGAGDNDGGRECHGHADGTVHCS